MKTHLQKKQFVEWIDQYRGIPGKLSRAFAVEVADQEDLHQEMLVQLWRSIPRYKRQAKASTWIYRVCLNTALTWTRGQSRIRDRQNTDHKVIEGQACEAAGPLETHERQDMLECLYKALHGLRDGDRSLVLLALDGLSYREISEVTGMTENNVGVALSRARKKLSNNMKELSNEF